MEPEFGDPMAGGDMLGGDMLGGDSTGSNVDHSGGFGGIRAYESHISDVYSAGASAPTGDLDSHLWMHDDGRIWDLGPAEVDTDNDGVNDSLTRNGPDGLTVYTDSDRDGQVDKITEIDADGDFRSAVLDPQTGAWIATDSGRLD